MSLKIIDKRNIAVNLIGYGKPESPLWLMGVEESNKGKWTLETTDEKFMSYKNGFTSEISINDLRSEKGTYNSYYKLIHQVFSEYEVSNNFFIANLLPFGKHNSGTEIPKETLEVFGTKSHKELYEISIDARHEVLINFFKKYNWKDKFIIFCVGKTNNKEIELVKFLSKLYKINSSALFQNIYIQDEKELSDSFYLFHDNEYKKFITYQASYYKFRNKSINRISSLIKKG